MIFMFIFLCSILISTESKVVRSNYLQTNSEDYTNQEQTDSNLNYLSIQELLINQKSLDCHQFDTDLIECFAFNLFIKSNKKFQDLNPENEIVKPILTKQFSNKTVNIGDNVTFTCETQIDALPMFLFYKLNETILNVYNSKSNVNSLLDKYAKPLQDKKSISDFVSTNPRILIERREHILDSNKDSLSDLESVSLTILNINKQDKGFYLCIVANSLNSFRVTYAYLNVTQEEKSNILLVEEKLESFFDKNKYLIITIVCLISSIALVFFTILICYCSCVNLIKQNKTNLETKTSSLLEKTMGSMKKNFVYVTMPDQSLSSTLNNNNNNNNHKLVNQQSNKLDSTLKEATLLIQNDHLFMNKNNIEFLDHDDDDDNNHDENDLKWEFPRDKLKIGKLIDEGAFGRVYKAEAYGILSGRYKTIVAVKMLKENATKVEFANFVKELEIMKSVGRHENIISLLGCCSKSGPLYAIVEYARLGNLRNYLRTQRPKDYMLLNGQQHQQQTQFSDDSDENSNPISTSSELETNLFKLYSSVNKNKILAKPTSSSDTNKNSLFSSLTKCQQNSKLNESLDSLDLIIELIKYCVQISSGMKYLHSKKVCHRDLAARNILLDDTKTAKIADFGLARDLQNNYYYTRKSESPIPVKWMAPETLLDRKIYQNSDIWSFGILMWEIFTLGANPYPTVPVEKLFDYLKQGNRMSKPMYSDDEIYQLMLDCWNLSPEQRPSFIALNEKLSIILDKYESKRNQQAKLNEMEKLFDENSSLTHSTLGFNKLFTPKSIISQADTLMSTSSSILTIVNPLSSRQGSTNLTQINTIPIQSRKCESESDSQYFSGADTSLVYADSSNFSTTESSLYSNYTIPISTAAFKEVSKMAAQLAQSPPSPPPPKSFSKLLNVASAAYQL